MTKMKEGKQLISAVFGTFLFAAGMNLFIVPSGMYSGGFLGIGQMIRTILTDLNFMIPEQRDISGVIYYMINIPLLFLAWRDLGRDFFHRTLVCVTIQSVFLMMIPANIPLLFNQPFASSVVGGVVCGYGVGLTLREGGSGGGQDVLGLWMMRKSNNLSVGRVSLFINIAVYAWCAFRYDIEIAVFSAVYAVVSSFVTDFVHLQNRNTGMIAVSDTNEMASWLIENCNRSATILEGVGGYSGKTYYVIYAVVSGYEAHQIQQFLKKRNAGEFVAFVPVDKVCGKFDKHL